MDPLAAWIAVRTMEHRERMEMIRRGLIPAPYAPVPLFAPVVLLLGIVLLAAAYLIGLGAIFYPAAADIGLSLAGGAILAVVAIALMVRLRRRRAPVQRIKDAEASLMRSRSINKDVTCR